MAKSKSNAPHYFISHSGEDKVVALCVARLLASRGQDYFLDVFHCRATNKHAILSAVLECTVFIGVTSTYFFKSDWAQREFDFAKNLCCAGTKKEIFLLRTQAMCEKEFPGTSAHQPVNVEDEIRELFSKFLDFELTAQEDFDLPMWLQCLREQKEKGLLNYEQMKRFVSGRQEGEVPVANGIDNWKAVVAMPADTEYTSDVYRQLQSFSGSLEEYYWFEQKHIDELTYGRSNERQNWFAEQGVTRWVVNAMKLHAENAMIQAKCCRIFSRLCRIRVNRNDSYISDNMRLIPELGGVTAIIDGMELHNENEEVQKEGCYAIVNLAWDSDNRIKIAEANGIQVLLGAMDTHSQNETVQFWSCWALYNLVHDNEENGALVGKLDGCSRLERAMEEFPEGSVRMEAGCALAKVKEATAKANRWNPFR